MLKTLLVLLAVLTSQSALACAVNTGSAQYEKNVEDGISQKRQQVEKMQKLGMEEESETVVALQKQLQDSIESQPISKNVNVEKYNIVYDNCRDKLNAKNKTVTPPSSPCDIDYSIKECASEAYTSSKK